MRHATRPLRYYRTHDQLFVDLRSRLGRQLGELPNRRSSPMRIAETLLNRSEAVAFRELQSIADDNGMLVFAKPRLSDVILKGRAHLTQR